jgi:hypothetical protein
MVIRPSEYVNQRMVRFAIPPEPVIELEGALEDGPLEGCGQCADLPIELADSVDEELSLLWPRWSQTVEVVLGNVYVRIFAPHRSPAG